MKRLLVIILLMLASRAQADIYTWKDSRGIAHYTNKEYDIPVRYKVKAKPLNIEAAQAGGASTATTQPMAPSQSPPQPQTVPSNPVMQPIIRSAEAPPQNVRVQPRRKHKIRSGRE
ncbi:DUF4124 domain-containing protein [Geobacter sp. AOG2]|uniref:DUF4124 domain-containing protein n=1 Tax=Geobacter sp. AOG2 TaxID=1566347 RepID=UPI001CC434B6|nr:DUF4124 domain-containing protein [Geobacter sp. AOG2]GFE60940.1 hypothetical protein AOG2_15270 [Geobacter sp. AOG2]